MADLTAIKFVHEDAATIIAECKTDLETRLGKQIAPADVEMLLINGLAYREMILRAGINETGRQNMVSFARGSALEYLGLLVGVSRLPAAAAACTIEFALVVGHNGVIIPEGLRVQSTDGKVIFQTVKETVCSIGTLSAHVLCAAATAGTVGNGYGVNKVSIILDPKAFVATAGNIDITAGGSDEETDELLRERIQLAPAVFSVAGPDDAYRFHAKSAGASIVDVAVTSPVPGQVNLYPLLEGGVMPTQEILDAVSDKCNSKKIRPLTDTVVVAAPTNLDYSIVIDVTLLTTAVGSSAITNIQNKLDAYKQSRKNKLGLDVIKSKWASLASIEGVYDAVCSSPANNIIANPNQYTNCTGITVNLIGTHDE